MKLLAPTDFSDASTSAVRYALELAKRLKGSLTLLTVIGYVGDNALSHWRHLGKSETQAANRAAEQLIADLDGGAVAISHKAVSGHPIAREVCKFSTREKMDLVVMGTHGASLRQWIGSNTEDVIAESDIPVMAIPAGYAFCGIRKIVYATDKEHLRHEVTKMANFANLFDAELLVLHISPTDSKQQLSKVLEPELVNLTECSGLSYHEVKSDDVDTAIWEFAKSNGADVLAIFAHEANVLQKVLRKSNTRTLTASIEMPMIVFKL